MSMEINTFKYENADGKLEIPFDGETYLNATEVYQGFGKSQTSFSNWKTRTLIPYAQKLLDLGKFVTSQNVVTTNNQVVTLNDLIVVRKGNSEKFEQGTWLHPKLAIVFARWIDLEFEIWCDEKIAELLNIGVSRMQVGDMKYLDLLHKVVDHAKSSDKQFARTIKAMLTLHEEGGYNIKKFDDLLNAISANTDKPNRVQLYEKVSKVIEQLYQEGSMDITTRERMRSACDARLLSILKSRATKAEKKLKNITIKSPANKETHDQLAAMSVELAKANAALEVARGNSVGIDVSTPKTDVGLIGVEFTTTNIIADLRYALSVIEDHDYKLLFQSFILPNPKATAENKRPPVSGECTVVGVGRMGAGIWNNENSRHLSLSRYGVDGSYVKIQDLNLYPSRTDIETFKAFNKNGTLYAVYNEPTGSLLVYAIKVTAN